MADLKKFCIQFLISSKLSSSFSFNVFVRIRVFFHSRIVLILAIVTL